MDKVYIVLEDYADANVGEQGAVILGVKGDYIDGYVDGEYIWTHDHVCIEEQQVK